MSDQIPFYGLVMNFQDFNSSQPSQLIKHIQPGGCCAKRGSLLISLPRWVRKYEEDVHGTAP
jgi:hypothetical protein